MPDPRLVERLWFSPDAAARAGRAALFPLELAYGGVVALRALLYDAGVLATVVPPIPALSVGNLTVGGTGKTPIAAWLAGELGSRGAKPAVVLRGYGGDEPLVHRTLNPGMTVVVSPDRAAGVERAAEAGCDIAVLDDAFQHRRAARIADVVLVSAERWSDRQHLLPAGPWREPLSALKRARLVIVTRKSASLAQALRVAESAARASGVTRTAIIHLALGDLRMLSLGSDGRVDTRKSVAPAVLAGRPVLAISAVGDPVAFERQLAARGARVVSRSFGDHYRFGAPDAARLASAASELAGAARDVSPVAVCTLKDAVKLAPLWPREAPRLWYVSQQPEVESGRTELDALIADTLAARHRQP